MAILRRGTLSSRGFSRNSWPKGPVEIDGGHPLAADLIAFWAFGSPSGLVDLCGNAGALTPAPAALMTQGAQGPGWAGNANDQYLFSAPVPALFKRTDAASVFWLGESSGAPTTFGGPLMMVEYNNALVAPFHCYGIMGNGPSGGTVGPRIEVNNAGTEVIVAQMADATGRNSLVGTFTFPSGTGFLYRNGGSISGSANGLAISGTATGTPNYTATSLIAINGYPVATSRTMNKTTYAAGIWKRALTQNDATWLDAEPYAMLRPLVRRAYYIPPPVTIATSYTLGEAPTSGTVGSSFTETATPNGTWPTGGGALVFTISGTATFTMGSATGGTLTGTGPYTLTPTAGSAAVSVPITPTSAGTVIVTPTNTFSPALTNPGATTYTAGAVVPTISDPTLTPSSPFAVGTVVTASGSFANGTPGGINILVDGSVVGTATVGSGTYTGTFSAPAPAGGHNVQMVETGIASPASSNAVSFTDTASALIIAPNNPAINYSPYNIYNNGSIEAVVWNFCGYWEMLFTGSATCVLNFDVSALGTSRAPQIWWSIDNGAKTRVAVAATVALTIPVPSTGTPTNSWHHLVIEVAGTDDAGARFSATASARLRFTGITLDSGATVFAPVKHALNIAWFGDSIGEGSQANMLTNDGNPLQPDGAASIAAVQRKFLGAEIGVISWGSTGYLASSSDIPTFPNHWNLYATGLSRVLTPEPDLVVINHGTNDASSDITSAAVGVVNAMLTQWPHTRIILLNPIPQPTDPQPRAHPNTFLQAAARTCNDPARVTYLDTLGLYDYHKGAAAPGFHPSQANANALVGRNIANLLRPYLAQKLIKRWNYT